LGRRDCGGKLLGRCKSFENGPATLLFTLFDIRVKLNGII